MREVWGKEKEIGTEMKEKESNFSEEEREREAQK